MKTRLINATQSLNRHKNKLVAFIVMVAIFGFTALPAALAVEWPGVDKTVVEKYAEQSGRPAWKPFINTDQGDLLLFMFLLAGMIGGFIMGYYWRVLFSERRGEKHECQLHGEELVQAEQIKAKPAVLQQGNDTDGAQ